MGWRVRLNSYQSILILNIRVISRLVTVLVLLVGLSLPAHAEEITVAAAADLTFAFHEVATEFQQATGNSIRLSFGSSGNFFSQIRNGAPYDVFFSADVSYPKKLAAAGLTEPGSMYQYARGQIVVWIPEKSRLDVTRGLQILLDPAIRKTAIANPEHAPYGRAAIAAMRHTGVYEKVRGKLIYGENIAQAAQFVQSGNADAGVLALSIAKSPTIKAQGKYSIVPLSDYPPLEQAGVILKTSRNKAAARMFLDFLKRPAAVKIMARYGFMAPGKSIDNSAPETRSE